MRAHAMLCGPLAMPRLRLVYHGQPLTHRYPCAQVTFEEFRAFVVAFRMVLETQELKELWAALDTDNSGKMTLEEFIERCYPGIDLMTVDGLEANAEGSPKAGDTESSKHQHSELMSAVKACSAQSSALENRITSVESALANRLQHIEDTLSELSTNLARLPPLTASPTRSKLRSADFRSEGDDAQPTKDRPSRENGESRRAASRRDAARNRRSTRHVESSHAMSPETPFEA